jgi:hypothetical protein
MKFWQIALSSGVLAASVLGAQAAPRHHQSQSASAAVYDGRWSVEVITDQGTCDRAYRWSIGIRGGRITDIGDNIAQASGKIAPNGRVSVLLTRGSDRLMATGALDREEGSGTWQAPSRQCAGRWRAERRG